MLYHDSDQHVIIIEDLGNLPTADVWLQTPNLDRALIMETAENLGIFLADLHLSTTSENRSSLSNSFANEDRKRVVFDFAVEPLKQILEEFNIPQRDKIYETVETEFYKAQQNGFSHVFSMGDLWTSSVLVSESSGETKIGLIDWEFACLASPSQDIGQFGKSSCDLSISL